YDVLRDGLDVSHAAMNVLTRHIEMLEQRRELVSVPKLISLLEDSKEGHAQSRAALLERLQPLARRGKETFSSEHDIHPPSDLSMIFNEAGANAIEQRLLFNLSYENLRRTEPVQADWRLCSVALFHEAADLLMRSQDTEFFFEILTRCRNYGLGLVFCTQYP